MPPAARPSHVVIAGGGVAAVECALALRALARDRVRLTLLAPEPSFALHALQTAEPFARDHVRRHPLDDLAARVGAELVQAPLTQVIAERHRVLAGARAIGYDALVVAVGGRRRPAFARALTFGGPTATLDYSGLLADVDEGYAQTISFVVPPRASWPLPLYELALMTAREAWSMGIADLRLTLVTPEATPLAMFGPQAGAAVAELLDRAGIAFRGGAYVRERADGELEVLPGGEPLAGRRVVALPVVDGPRVAGLPCDEHGFLPIDDACRVLGCEDVYAAGDGTTFPVKQGGIACQQADAIASLLAHEAGADVEPEPFRPVLRGRVLDGRGAQYVEHALHGGAGDGPPSELRRWSVAHKVEGRWLSPWLAELER